MRSCRGKTAYSSTCAYGIGTSGTATRWAGARSRPGSRSVELESFPQPTGADDVPQAANDIVVPMRLAVGDDEISLLYAVTVFGAPRDVTLDEVAIETFFPADDATARVLRAMAE